VSSQRSALRLSDRLSVRASRGLRARGSPIHIGLHLMLPPFVALNPPFVASQLIDRLRAVRMLAQ
jgi:hypothetical protein